MYGIFHTTRRFERGATKESCQKFQRRIGSVKTRAQRVIIIHSWIKNIFEHLENIDIKELEKRMIHRVAKKLS